MSLSAAKSRVNQAKSQLESRPGEVEATIVQAEKFLEGLAESEAAPIRAELAAIRAQLAAMPSDEETRNLSAAKGKIRQARSQIADRQILGIEGTVAAAERHLAIVREQHRGAVGTDLAALKAEIAALQPDAPAAKPVAVDDRASGARPTPAAPTSAPSAPPAVAVTPSPSPAGAAPADRPLTDDEHADLSRGRSRVGQARNAAEAGRTEHVEGALAEAAAFLDKVPAHHTTALRAQMVEIRAMGAAAAAKELNRRATGELDRHLRLAESDRPILRFGSAAAAYDHVTTRLADADVLAGLSADEVTAYRAAVAAGRIALAAAIKADALDRARPLIEEAEQIVATDPLAGLEQYAAYKVIGEVNRLRTRIHDVTRTVPDGDPDVGAILQRLTAVDIAMDKASAAWGKASVESAVSNSWALIEREIAGWDAEVATDDAGQLYEPNLPLTRTAIQRIRYLLDAPETRQTRSEHRGDPGIEGPFEEAERVLAAAAERLYVAYSQVLAAADRMETPLNRFLLDRPALLAYGAESAFAGTRYQEPIVTRARALDARWKAEVAAIMRARQALFEQLSAETAQTWPAIRDATGAQPFDPTTARPGSVIRLDDVYNRSGWDYGDRAFGFAAAVSGVLIGGYYEPHVLAALEHAWYELKLDVSDRFPWDLVGVVEGAATIGVRTTVTLRDARTHQELGKLEEWPPSPCLRIRIIALHAGPVAVGPG